MIPNLISISRIILILPIIFCMIINNLNLAFFIFLVASFTDFLDGYLARYLNQESLLGANLDLLADKIFICSLLIFVSFHFDNFTFLVMTILIVARELSIGNIRQYYLETKKINKAKVNFLGKFKTFFMESKLVLSSTSLFLSFNKTVVFSIFFLSII